VQEGKAVDEDSADPSNPINNRGFRRTTDSKQSSGFKSKFEKKMTDVEDILQ
jgi:hypothetical protein